MAKPSRPWIVSPHDPIAKHEANLWTVEGRMPGVPIRRRMSIIRRGDGTLVFFNAVPLEPGALAEVLAWGRPGALVVPHHLHGLDATPFSERLGVGIYGPRRSEAQMRRKFTLAGCFEDLPPDPALAIEPLDGSRAGEPAVIVRSGARVSLLFADAYQDYSNLDIPLFMRLLGFGGGPKTPPAFRLLFTTDVGALRAHLARLAELPGLHRLVPCHGPIVESVAAAVLRRVAAGR
jgi:hypothetical protein